jgi:MFS family permease
VSEAGAAASEIAAGRARSGLATYYALIGTQTVSLMGSRISTLAVSIAIFRQTGHATPLALVAFFATAPMVVLGGFAGALSDRFDRRRIMLVANLGYLACASLLLASFASGAFRLWHLYVLSLANAVFLTAETPAFVASVAMLVPDAHRDRANAIGQLTGPAAGVIAPAAAGLLYATIGATGAIALSVATFAIAIAVLAIVRIPRPTRTAEGALADSVWRQAFDGYRYLWERPVTLGYMGFLAVVNFLGNGAGVLQAPYVLDRTSSAAAMGLVLGALNLGALAGGLFMSVWGGTRPRMHTVILGIAIEGLFLALAGAMRGPVGLGASFFAFMFPIPIANAAAISIFQAKIAPDVQGRVFAASMQVNSLLTPIALLLAGPLADRVFEPARRAPAWGHVAWLVGRGAGAGMGLMFVLAGLGVTLVSLAIYAVPAIRRIESVLPDYTPA